ncbi:MAG: PDZ domain-containing protein [Planctomycetota bacterium]
MPASRISLLVSIFCSLAIHSRSVPAQSAEEAFKQQQELVEQLQEAKEATEEPVDPPAFPFVSPEASLGSSLVAPSLVGPGIVQGANWPGRLHVDVDFLEHRGVVKVLLNDVFVGGVAHSMGLLPGDMIVGVNHQLIRSQDEFRRIIQGPIAPVLHVQSISGHVRVVQYRAITANGYFAGVNGHLDYRNEFVVDFIAPHDPLTQHLGLRRGDKILAIGGQPIHSAAQLKSIIKPYQGQVAIVLLRDGRVDPETILFR